MAEKGFSEYFVDDGSDFSVEHGAILIVDMLNDFCKDGGKMPLKEGMETVEPLKALIAKGREKGLPIIYINDCHRADKYDKEFEKRAPHCIEGTWGAAVIDELAPRPEDYQIPKRRFSGFIRLIWIWVCGSWGLKL